MLGFALSIVSSSTKKRFVYFETMAAVEYWHKKILSAQGFLENRIVQYEPLSKLGSGSFGTVVLSQHNYSGVKVAIK